MFYTHYHHTPLRLRLLRFTLHVLFTRLRTVQALYGWIPTHTLLRTRLFQQHCLVLPTRTVTARSYTSGLHGCTRLLAICDSDTVGFATFAVATRFGITAPLHRLYGICVYTQLPRVACYVWVGYPCPPRFMLFVRLCHCRLLTVGLPGCALFGGLCRFPAYYRFTYPGDVPRLRSSPRILTTFTFVNGCRAPDSAERLPHTPRSHPTPRLIGSHTAAFPGHARSQFCVLYWFRLIIGATTLPHTAFFTTPR